MAAKHTPGPWTVSKDQLRGGTYFSVSRNGKGERSYEPIDIHEDENGEADVCLIAAAPDLLEALKHLVFEAKADGMDKRAGWDCWVSVADKAIAKAEGGIQ